MADRPPKGSADEGPTVVLVHGDATPLVEAEVARWIARWEPLAQPASFNRSVWGAGDERSVDALADARTPPMMAAVRLVVVRDLHDGTNGFFEALEAYLESPVLDTRLLLTGHGFPRVVKGGRNWASRIPRRVASAGEVVRCRVRDVSPRRFAQDHARSLDRVLEPEAAALLEALVGDDLAKLAREVEKLDLAVEPGARIDAAAVGEAVASTAGEDAFVVLRAIVARDTAEALGRVSRLMDEGESVDRFMGALLWKARQIVQATPLVRRGMDPRGVGQAIGMRPGDAAALVRALSEQPPPPRLVPRIVETWTQLRSARGDARRRVEALVLALAS